MNTQLEAENYLPMWVHLNRNVSEKLAREIEA